MNQKTNLPFELEPSWREVLADEFSQPYMSNLLAFLEEDLAKGPMQPTKNQVFNAFNLTPYHDVKVVIFEEEPHVRTAHAHGLSYSVPRGVAPTSTLLNMYKELREDLGIEEPAHGDLTAWAKQGVFLLNTTLTVRNGDPRSHKGQGWERFTDAVVAQLCMRKDPVIFVAWGRAPKDKLDSVTVSEGWRKHYLLSADHPSLYTAHRGFFGCRHFSKVNEILKHLNKNPIDWFLAD